MNKQVSRSGNGRWQKGSSGNPAGRPLSARQKISERLLGDLQEVWEQHGKSVLLKLAKKDPGRLAQIAYGLLPRDIFLTVEHKPPGNMTAEDWQITRDMVELIKASMPEGATKIPAEIRDAIEHALRSSHAVQIEQTDTKSAQQQVISTT